MRLAVLGLLAGLLGLAGTMGHAHEEDGWLAGGLPDYAPAGVPDFSQCRGAWSVAGTPGQWTHAGPVSLATALWWLDSRSEPAPAPPPAVRDGHALVTAYPVFGPPRDDHSIENIGPLVEDLALRSNTNGVRTAESLRGTRWEDLVSAAEAYLDARRRSAPYRLEQTGQPTADWVAAALREGGAVVLALGVWQDTPGQAWGRVGGHYATVSGLAADGSWVGLSDPLADAAAFGGEGRAVPDGHAAHGCREAPRGHDDAAAVSHDLYRLRRSGAEDEALLVLEGYFVPETYHDAAAFAGQNPMGALAERSATWRRGPVTMAVDAALAIVPDGRMPGPTPSPPPSATATASATPIATTPVPSPPPPPTATPTAPGPAPIRALLPLAAKGR